MAKTHGMRHTRIYSTWLSMKDRCLNPNCKSYFRYGDRGIAVCDEWVKNFQSFYDWSMTNGYADNLTIDRIDNDGNYEPDNCRWATRKIQNNNKSSNIPITYNGETHNIAEWESRLGFKKNVLYARIFQYGIPVNVAMNYKRRYESQDIGKLEDIDLSKIDETNRCIVEMRLKGMSFRKIADKLGMSHPSVRERLYRLIEKERTSHETTLPKLP